MDWIETRSEMPPKGEIVAIWNHHTRRWTSAKWNGRQWMASGGFRTKRSDVTHWAHVTPPSGVSAMPADRAFDYSTADSQDNGFLR